MVLLLLELLLHGLRLASLVADQRLLLEFEVGQLILLDELSLLLKLLSHLVFDLLDLVFCAFLKLLGLDHSLLIHVTVRSQFLHADHLIKLSVIKQEYLFWRQSVVLLGHSGILESCFHLPSSDNILAVQVVILLEEVLQELGPLALLWLLVLRRIPDEPRQPLELGPLVLMLGIILALLAPVHDISLSQVGRALLANVHPLVQIYQ